MLKPQFNQKWFNHNVQHCDDSIMAGLNSDSDYESLPDDIDSLHFIPYFCDDEDCDARWHNNWTGYGIRQESKIVYLLQVDCDDDGDWTYSPILKAGDLNERASFAEEIAEFHMLRTQSMIDLYKDIADSGINYLETFIEPTERLTRNYTARFQETNLADKNVLELIALYQDDKELNLTDDLDEDLMTFLILERSDDSLHLSPDVAENFAELRRVIHRSDSKDSRLEGDSVYFVLETVQKQSFSKAELAAKVAQALPSAEAELVKAKKDYEQAQADAQAVRAEIDNDDVISDNYLP